jgi:hypothetical protein
MTIPTHLTDVQLEDALKRCARKERHATAALVAHLAEMDARLIHLRQGFPSLFAYCCEVLRLSESASYKRIEVARATRRHPILLERLSDGRLNLTTARLLAPHLTAGNRQELLEAASRLGKRAVEELLARRFPRPDVASSVRKLGRPLVLAASARLDLPSSDPAGFDSAGLDPAGLDSAGPTFSAPAGVVPAGPDPASPIALVSRPSRPLCVPLAADRYQIRFTASAATWKKLCMARDLLRHSVPSGDPAEIFERALTALLANLTRTRCAQVTKPRRRDGPSPTPSASRHVPAAVRRAVWIRDQGRCAYVSPGRRRCGERGFLEFHHVQPYAVGGPATIGNVELRCRAHNAYEAIVFYGPRASSDRSAGAHESIAGMSPQDSTGPGASWRDGESAP